MKRAIALVLLFVMLTGCKNSDGIGPALKLRESLLSAQGCKFQADITADYGDSTYAFSIDCTSDKSGNIVFTVASPESISGISGTVDFEGGELVFDDQILAFPLLADGYISPISVPWLFVKALRSGYINSGGADGDLYKVQMDDSYEEDPLTMDVWLDSDNKPVHCDFLWQNRRILSARIKNFSFV